MDPILAKVEAPPTATFLDNKHSTQNPNRFLVRNRFYCGINS
jgi:hypothetical protein